MESILKASFRNCPLSERALFSESRCLLPISVGQPIHEGHKFKTTLSLVNRSFESCVILIDDTVQRYTLKIFNDLPLEELYHQAKQLGDEWLERNRPAIDTLTIPHKVIRWDQWLHHPDFPEKLALIEEHLKEDADFKNAFVQNCETYLSRMRQRIQTVMPYNPTVTVHNNPVVTANNNSTVIAHNNPTVTRHNHPTVTPHLLRGLEVAPTNPTINTLPITENECQRLGESNSQTPQQVRGDSGVLRDDSGVVMQNKTESHDFYPRAFDLCFEYLKEECAGMCLWHYEHCEFEVYPSDRNQAMTATYKRLIKPYLPALLRPVALRFKKYALSQKTTAEEN